MRRAIWLLFVSALLAGCAPGPRTSASPQGGTQPSAPRQTQRIVLGIPGQLPSFRSQTNTITPGVVEVEQIVNAGLATVDDHGNLLPRLAEAVPTVENGLWTVSPDGQMETTWKIRENAAWHDGAPFTSADVNFSVVTVGQDTALPAFHHIAYDSIDRVDMPDPKTAVVHWKTVNIDADKIISSIGTTWPLPLPEHILGPAREESRDTFMDLPYWNMAFVGTGPYRVREYVAGVRVDLEANPSYVLGRPKIDEIEVRFIADTNTLAANLLSGAVDSSVGRSLSLDQALQVRSQWADGSVAVIPQSVVTMFPQFINPNPAVIGDVRLRRAILYATDRQEMVDTLEHGQSRVAHAFLNPNEPEYPEVQASIIQYGYDPAEAIRQIEQTGYARTADGTFVSATGAPLSLPAQVTSEDLSQKALLSVSDYLKQVGVAMEIEFLAPQRADDRAYRSTRPGFDLARTPNSISAFLSRNHGSQTGLPEDNFRRYTNKSRYMNKELDGLIDTYFATIPHQERVAVLGQIVHHMSDQLNIVPLFYDTEVMAYNNRLVGVTPKQSELSSPVWNIHQWDVK